jgi:hypothetical protein
MFFDIILTGLFGVAVAYAYIFIKSLTTHEQD